MKVAILTLRLHINYGGILQAYALMTVLKRLGHEPWLILNRPFKRRKWYSRYLLYVSTAFRKFVLQEKILEIFKEKRLFREHETLCIHTNRFVDQYLQPQTVAVCTEKEWNTLHDKYGFDAYIVGSDQVWRSLYAQPISRYFFSFLEKVQVKKMAYAASFGIGEWDYTRKQTKVCAKLVQEFVAVSVREDSAVGLCRDYLGVESVLVLDPTLLLTMQDYKVLLPPSWKSDSRKGILVYLLDVTDWKVEFVKAMEHKLECTSFCVNNIESEKEIQGLEGRVVPPVENWLAGFANAQYVVTDSFHACVFSILFHLPFWVCGNEKRGMERFKSLLSLFDLEERFLKCGESFSFERMGKGEKIDWAKVDEKLNEMRSKSFDFLLKNLV